MTTYIYCPRKSQGALELVRALEATRLRRFDGMDFWDKKKRMRLNDGDILICWGAQLPMIDGLRILNATEKALNKFEEWMALYRAEISSVYMYTPDQVAKGQIHVKKERLIPRSAYHVGGADILTPTNNPDFYSVKVDLVNEFRIHSFAGRSIRAGKKVVREGFNLVDKASNWKPNANLAHPWVRSFDGGWRLQYDGFQSTAQQRTLAHKAVKALGLTFAAVDIGEMKDGGFIVLEVNRAPGIEGNSVQTYAKAIKRWIDEPQAVEAEANGPF